MDRERLVKRTWWAFRIGMWALVVAGVALIMLGRFWLGFIALLGAAAVRIAWGEWSRWEQSRLNQIHKWNSASKTP